MLLGHLEIVLPGHLGAVSDPLTDHVDREFVGQFSLPRRPQVVKRAGPSRDRRIGENSEKLGAKVGVVRSVAGHHVDGALLGIRKSPLKEWAHLVEQRNDPGFRLAAADQDAAAIPVDVLPPELKGFRGAPDSGTCQ